MPTEPVQRADTVVAVQPPFVIPTPPAGVCSACWQGWCHLCHEVGCWCPRCVFNDAPEAEQ